MGKFLPKLSKISIVTDLDNEINGLSPVHENELKEGLSKLKDT